MVVDDAANTVTFHLVAPNPEFLARLTLGDAVAVPAETPNRDIGWHPLPSTGPYMWSTITNNAATLVRNPYFHEWSHAARPDGYVDRIVFRRIGSQAAELADIERGLADVRNTTAAPEQPRRASDAVRQPTAHASPGKHQRADPQHADRAV